MFFEVTKPFINTFKDKNIPLDVSIISILLYLLPILIITGPAIPDIILSIISIYFLIKSFFSKLKSYYSNKVFYFFILFCLYSIIRAIFSEFPNLALLNEGSIFYFRYIFFAISIWYILDNNPYLLKGLLISLIFCLVIVIPDGLYQYFTGENILGFKKHGLYRLTGLFNDEPILGRYITYCSLMVFFLIYQLNKINHKNIILSILLLVTCEIVIFLTGERTPLFYVVLFSILIIIFIPKFRIYRILGFFLSSIIIFAILQFNPVAKDRMVNITLDQISETHLPFLPYSEIHEQHYISALKMFIDKPLIGVGTSLFRYKCKEDIYLYKDKSCTSHPHNYYIQTLAELGIVGFLFLIIAYGYLVFLIIKQVFYNFKQDDSKILKFKDLLNIIILFIYFWPLIPHMSFYNNWNNVFLMMHLGFFLKFLYSKNNNYLCK